MFGREGACSCCRGAGVCLSIGQETLTVSPVSFTANEFPGGWVVAV